MNKQYIWRTPSIEDERITNCASVQHFLYRLPVLSLPRRGRPLVGADTELYITERMRKERDKIMQEIGFDLGECGRLVDDFFAPAKPEPKCEAGVRAFEFLTPLHDELVACGFEENKLIS